MSYIARCHPLCGWLRLQPQDYARTMEQLLKQRDDYLLIKPDHSGPAPGYMQWVWDVELPQLANNPYYAAQIIERVGDLELSSSQLSDAIEAAVGNKLAELQSVDSEADKLRAAGGLD